MTELPHDDAPDQPMEERRPWAPLITGHRGIATAQVWIAVFLLAVAGFIVFAGVLRIPFHPQEVHSIVKESAYHHVTTAVDAVDLPAPRPLSALSQALSWAIRPDSAFGFRLLNVILHVFNAILGYLIARKLLRRGAPEPVAMAAGLLLLFYPTATYAVAPAAGRDVLLATFLALLALLLYLNALNRESTGPGWGYAGALVFAVLAWASHEAALCLPIIFLAAAAIFVPGENGAKRFNRHAAVLAGLLALLLAVHYASEIPLPLAPLSWSTALYDASTAAALAAMPWNASVVSPAAAGTPPGGIAVLVVGGAAALFLLWRRSKAAAGLTWFVVALLFFASDAAGTAVPLAQRLYVPLVGLFLIAPMLFQFVPDRARVRQAAAVVASTVLIVCAGLTYMQNQDWREPRTMWSTLADRNPDATAAQLNAGEAYAAAASAQWTEASALAAQGEASGARAAQEEAVTFYNVAIGYLERARELAPDTPKVYALLGTAYARTQQGDKAIEMLEEALWHAPHDLAAAAELASLYHARSSQTGSRDDLFRAVKYYERARDAGSLAPQSQVGYGLALASLGDVLRAKEVLDALDEADSPPQLAQTRRQIDAIAGQVAQLEGRVRELAQTDPESPELLLLQGRALLLQNQHMDAFYLLRQYAKAHPEDPTGWVWLGLAEARLGELESFLAEFPPPAAPEGVPAPTEQLAVLLASTGNWNGAEAVAKAGPVAGDAGRTVEMALAEMAVAMRDVERAESYWRQAAEKSPDAYAPWLLGADVALARGDAETARGHLAEAEKRGAPEDALKARRDRLPQSAPPGAASEGGIVIR